MGRRRGGHSGAGSTEKDDVVPRRGIEVRAGDGNRRSHSAGLGCEVGDRRCNSMGYDIECAILQRQGVIVVRAAGERDGIGANGTGNGSNSRGCRRRIKHAGGLAVNKALSPDSLPTQRLIAPGIKA